MSKEKKSVRLQAELLEERIVGFCRLLRTRGLSVTPVETLDAVRMLPLVNLAEREAFRSSLKAVLVKRADDLQIFDQLFEEFWQTTKETRRATVQMGSLCEPGVRISRGYIDQWGNGLTAGEKLDCTTLSGETAEVGNGVSFYSPMERLGKRSFSGLTTSEVPEIRRTFRRIERRLATRHGRRFVTSKRDEFDLRKTVRHGLATGGELLRLSYRERETSRVRLVLLCDISRSMDAYSEELIKVLYAAKNAIRPTEAYAFSTRLVEMNFYLSRRALQEAAEIVSKSVRIWGSGTRIGLALWRLLSEHAATLRKDTVLMVISDGWEIGGVSVLEKSIREIRRRIRGIIWINPLADEPDYEPATLGMKTALPYIDIFGGMKLIKDRREFERTLKFGIASMSSNAVIPIQRIRSHRKLTDT